MPATAKASVKRVIGKIRHATVRNVLWLGAEEMVTGLNRGLVGWANYYSLGPVYQAYRAIDRYTPLRRWLRNKYKISNTGARCFAYEFLYDTLGLVSDGCGFRRRRARNFGRSRFLGLPTAW